MKVEIVSTQTIRAPAAAGESSTPAERCFTLSIFDQLMPALYVPVLLFYTATDLQNSAKSDILKKSLSETLARFFPLAGRISDNIRIADEGPAGDGIEYTEARVKGKLLRDILSPPNLEAIGELLPAVKNSWSTEKLLVVRESVFECGGMAVGICISHKVADGITIHSFLRSWSETARGGGSDMVAAAPYLSSSTWFPPTDVLEKPTHPELLNASRRFVLSGSQVASLKAKSRSQSVANPTKVEAVASLIWQCAIRSNNPSSSSSSSSSIWQAVNLRNRINPPLPDNTFGNLLGFYKTTTTAKNDDVASLVHKIRHAKEEYMRVYPKKLDQARDRSSAVCESFRRLSGVGAIFVSSVCKLDLYGACDFGWGKPIWATFYFNHTNYVYLSDTRDEDGIQVWLSLPKQQMDVFEKDPQLLTYATPNPSIYNVFGHKNTGSLPRFSRVSYSSTMLSRPNTLSQILLRHYSPRGPLCNIHSRRIIPTPPSIRFISSLLHLHSRKLIIR